MTHEVFLFCFEVHAFELCSKRCLKCRSHSQYFLIRHTVQQKCHPKTSNIHFETRLQRPKKAKLAQNTRITMSLMLPTIHVTLPLSFLFFSLSFCLRCCVNCFLLHQFLAHQLYSIDAFFIIWKHRCNSKYNGNYYYIRHFRNLKLLPHSVTKVSTISNNVLLL